MIKQLASGFFGAVALTAVHETARRLIPHAPRVDVIGVRAISRPLRAAGYQVPPYHTLHQFALAGDLVSNALYYSLIGIGDKKNVLKRGLALGAAAGIGAVLLPPLMQLGQQPHRKTPLTELLTVAWYTIGGLTAAGALKAINESDVTPTSLAKTIRKKFAHGHNGHRTGFKMLDRLTS